MSDTPAAAESPVDRERAFALAEWTEIRAQMLQQLQQIWRFEVYVIGGLALLYAWIFTKAPQGDEILSRRLLLLLAIALAATAILPAQDRIRDPAHPRALQREARGLSLRNGRGARRLAGLSRRAKTRRSELPGRLRPLFPCRLGLLADAGRHGHASAGLWRVPAFPLHSGPGSRRAAPCAAVRPPDGTPWRRETRQAAVRAMPSCRRTGQPLPVCPPYCP